MDASLFVMSSSCNNCHDSIDTGAAVFRCLPAMLGFLVCWWVLGRECLRADAVDRVVASLCARVWGCNVCQARQPVMALALA